MVQLWDQFKLLFDIFQADLISSQSHSNDFKYTRIGYIKTRTSLISIVLALLFVVWIIVDWQTLPHQQFVQMLVLRLLVASLLVLFTLLCLYIDKTRQQLFRYLVFSLFSVLGLFYLKSTQILGTHLLESTAISYSLLPFLFITISAILPLTLKESVFCYAAYLVVMLVKHYLFSTLISWQVLTDFWLLSMLYLITFLTQISQLHMLLRLYRQATRDPLTGLPNRRVLMKSMELHIQQSQKTHQPLSLLMFDLDKFKRINDNYGHQTGDKILKAFAKVLRKVFTNKEILGRYGGEEFMVLLPKITLRKAEEKAEQVRELCEKTLITLDNGHHIQFTTSIGIAELNKGEELTTLIERADNCLYSAKDAGRNCIYISV